MATSKASLASSQDASPKNSSRKAAKAATVANTQEIFDQLFSNPNDGEDLAGTLLLVDIDRVAPREHQPRTYFDPEALSELSKDIQELSARGGGVGGTGILQPLLVEQEDDTSFRIVAGERRYRAAHQAGLVTIPVIVRDTPAATGQGAEWWEDALRENIQREDLTPLEEAQALARLAQEHGYSVRVLAERLGKGKGYIEHRLALVKAGPDVQELVSRRRDTLSIAREIDKVEDAHLRSQLIAQALEGAPVKHLRDLIERGQAGQGKTAPKTAAQPNPQARMKALEKQIFKLGHVESVTMAAKALQHSVRCEDALSPEEQRAVAAAIATLRNTLEELESWSRNGKTFRK